MWGQKDLALAQMLHPHGLPMPHFRKTRLGGTEEYFDTRITWEIYIRNDSGHMFPNLVILVSTGKQEGLPGQGGQEIPKKSP